MAGCWPSSFFCVFIDRDEVEVPKLAKYNMAFGEIFLAGYSG